MGGDPELVEKGDSLKELQNLHAEAVSLIDLADRQGRLTDKVGTGLFEETEVFTHSVSEKEAVGLWVTRTTMTKALSKLIGEEKAEMVFDEDVVVEVGLWQRNSGTGREYTVRDGFLRLGEISEGSIKKPEIVDLTPDHLENVREVLNKLNGALSGTPTPSNS